MKQLIILVAVVIILIGAVVFLYSGDTVQAPTPTPTVPATSPGVSPVSDGSKTIVTYSDSGYEPSSISMGKGETVVFRNNSSKMMWTASDVHPTHKAYPASGIEMCGTETLVEFFDACGGYEPGESWEFRFDHPGTWSYHNHLQPNHRGTVVVE